jgi:hypothetical protein
MSRLSHSLKAARENAALKQDQIVTNYMGGQCYKLDPLQTLRIIASSSIFMEPSYYRPGKDARRSSEISRFDDTNDPLIALLSKSERSTTEIFTEAIDAALDFDFTGTLEFASQLRNLYNIRLNPQVIAVRAAIHPKRKEWTEKNPGMFEKYESEILSRADEPMTQLAYYIALKGGEKKKRLFVAADISSDGFSESLGVAIDIQYIILYLECQTYMQSELIEALQLGGICTGDVPANLQRIG